MNELKLNLIVAILIFMTLHRINIDCFGKCLACSTQQYIRVLSPHSH